MEGLFRHQGNRDPLSVEETFQQLKPQYSSVGNSRRGMEELVMVNLKNMLYSMEGMPEEKVFNKVSLEL